MSVAFQPEMFLNSLPCQLCPAAHLRNTALTAMVLLFVSVYELKNLRFCEICYLRLSPLCSVDIEVSVDVATKRQCQYKDICVFIRMAFAAMCHDDCHIAN